MKRVLRVIVIFLAIALVGGFIFFQMVDEAEPQGEAGIEAEAMADKMMAAVNKQAWDSTRYVQWTFKSVHHFLWDKESNRCRVAWEDNVAWIDLNNVTGKAEKADLGLDGQEAEDQIKTGWSHFCNDSFWLNAVVKAKDPGTGLSIVKLKDGREGLKVKYSSGGVTPGDAYVWILDENGRPTSYKMWVSIIPVGGLEFTWEDWHTLEGGAQVAKIHNSKVLNLDISNLKASQNIEDFGYSKDPFVW